MKNRKSERRQTAVAGRASVGTRRRRGVIVIGAGQHGRVVGSVLEAAGLRVVGHYDDDPGTWGGTIGRARVIGPLSELPSGAPAIIAIGDNEIRKRIARGLDLDWVTVIHPFSWLHPEVRPGPGTVVSSSVSVQIGAEIGAHVIINNGVGIGHDAQACDFAHLTVAHLGAGSRADEGSFLGIGSVVLPRLHVGAWATVGGGAVVTTDVRPGATVVGNPAREMASDGPLADARATV